MKTEKGILSAKQKEIHEIWAANDICVRIIRTLAEGIKIIEKIINEKSTNQRTETACFTTAC
jgi:hypothetical protein